MFKKVVVGTGLIAGGLLLSEEWPRVLRPVLRLVGRRFPKVAYKIDALRFHRHLKAVNADVDTALKILLDLPAKHQDPLLQECHGYDPEFYSAITSRLETGSQARRARPMSGMDY